MEKADFGKMPVNKFLDMEIADGITVLQFCEMYIKARDEAAAAEEAERLAAEQAAAEKARKEEEAARRAHEYDIKLWKFHRERINQMAYEANGIAEEHGWAARIKIDVVYDGSDEDDAGAET